MALVKVKNNKGEELVMQRKTALELAEKGELEIVSAPLDPRNEADKPLIDAYLEANPVEEIKAPEIQEETEA